MHDHLADRPAESGGAAPADHPTIDALVVELRRLRQEADNPSYAELAARIARARQASGEQASRARVARSTVYDVFRLGRRRLDVGLVREILAALGLEEAAVAHWTAVAQRAVPGEETTTPAVATYDEPEPVSEPEPVAEPEADPTPAPDLPTAAPDPRPSRRRGPTGLTLVLLGCVLGNLAGRVLADELGLPLHLDMVWTAVSAILLGPWWGVLVAIATNGLGVAVSGAASLPFVVVNVTGALVWGYGVRRFGMGRSVARFFTLNVLCGVACSVAATPVLLLFFDGTLGPQNGRVGDRLTDLTHVVVLSVFLPNLVYSLADKVVSGFVALTVIEARSPSRVGLGLDLGQLDLGQRDEGADRRDVGDQPVG